MKRGTVRLVKAVRPMTHFHRGLGIGCLAAALAACSLAQMPSTAGGSPSESIIKTWLGSGDLRLVAWGAYDALVARDPDLIPKLLALASRWQPLSRQTLDASHRAELSPEQIDE